MELEKLIERSRKLYVDWIIFRNPVNGALFLVELQGNSHIGTYDFVRVCDSSNYQRELKYKFRLN